MKKLVIAASSKSANAQLVDMLKAHGIDTTKHKYQLKAEGYERYGSGRRYTKTFTCPGNYLAYLSMLLHKQPTAEAIEDYYGSMKYFEEDLLESYHTVDDIADHAAAYWWGDGDDYIIYLKNLDTNEVLYEGEETEDYYEEDDWED